MKFDYFFDILGGQRQNVEFEMYLKVMNTKIKTADL